jgi:hypothetical protein
VPKSCDFKPKLQIRLMTKSNPLPTEACHDAGLSNLGYGQQSLIIGLESQELIWILRYTARRSHPRTSDDCESPLSLY